MQGFISGLSACPSGLYVCFCELSYCLDYCRLNKPSFKYGNMIPPLDFHDSRGIRWENHTFTAHKYIKNLTVYGKSPAEHLNTGRRTLSLPERQEDLFRMR